MIPLETIQTPYPVRSKSPLVTAASNGGFIALISAIIVAAILLIITTTLSFSGFFSRFDTLSNEFKDRSSALADACADAALLDLAENGAITAPSTVPVGTENCTIVKAQNNTPAAGETTIYAQASVDSVYTNLMVVAGTADGTVVSWEEVPNIP